ncbi:MAG: hypothetical protein O3A84_06965 [Proteobacteria bacterium]|nr:hypothetical protein [Pseudomonadota bacterium]
MLYRTLLIAGLSIAAVSVTTPVDAQYYKGKTINLLVPVPGGSGLDLNGRVIARYLEKHIPGNPRIVVRNMPGGGGVQSLNFLSDKGKPDGLTINFGPWNAGGVIAGLPGIRYTPEKFGFVGTASSIQLTIARTDIADPPMKKSADIVRARVFNVAGRTADRELDLAGNLALDIMGVKYRYVAGFRGMAKINPSIRRNEMQAGHSGYTGYTKFFRDSMIKNGEALALWYHSDFDADGNPIGNPAVTEFKPFHEVYQEVHGKLPSGPKWEAYKWLRSNISAMTQTVFMSPGSPQEALDDVRKGYYGMAVDKQYLTEIGKVVGIAPIPYPLEHGLNILRTFRKVSPQILATFKEMGTKGSDEPGAKGKRRKKK